MFWVGLIWVLVCFGAVEGKRGLRGGAGREGEGAGGLLVLLVAVFSPMLGLALFVSGTAGRGKGRGRG